MQVEKEDIQKRYAELQDEQLAEIKLEDLNELARACYSEEVVRRQDPEYREQERRRLELNESLPVLVRFPGAARSLTFPSRCPCCLGELNPGEETWDLLLADRSRIWLIFHPAVARYIGIPYCQQCCAHIQKFRFPRLFAPLVTVVGILVPSFGGVWLGERFFPDLSPGIPVLVLGAAVVISSLTAYFAIRPKRRDRAKQLTKPACCSAESPVRYLGDSVAFKNGKFGKAFAELNGLAENRQWSENVTF